MNFGPGSATQLRRRAKRVEVGQNEFLHDVRDEWLPFLLEVAGFVGHLSCFVEAVVAGEHRRVGVQRGVAANLTLQPAATAVPLLFNIHGTTEDAAYQQTHSKMNAKADSAGFIVVHPDGIGSIRGWNAGNNCCGTPQFSPSQYDDVGLIKAILARAKMQYRIDPKRVFATGHSSGGFLSYRLACEAAELFAAPSHPQVERLLAMPRRQAEAVQRRLATPGAP